MVRAAQFGKLWRIVSQVDLEEIKDEIEQTFQLLIVGDNPAQNRVLGRLLSSSEATFVHPWLSVVDAPLGEKALQGLGRVDLAILLSSETDLPASLRESQQTLAAAHIPSLLAIYGEAARRPDAAIARRDEPERVALPALNSDAVRDELVPALLQIIDPDLRSALGRRLPPLRAAVFNRLIQDTSQANATYAFSTGLAETIPALDIPLNLSDLLVLTKNQLVMGYRIALMAGKQGTPQQLIGEVAGVLGGSFLFRQLARQLVGLIPVWGIVPKVAVAYAGTWTIGRALVLWANEGQRITPELLRQFYTEALLQGRRVAQEIAGTLQERTLSIGEKCSTDNAPGEMDPVAKGTVWERLRQRLPFRRR